MAGKKLKRLKTLVKLSTGLVAIGCGAWAGMALYFHLPIKKATYGVIGVVFVLLVLRICPMSWLPIRAYPYRRMAGVLFWLVIASVLIWYWQLSPKHAGDWQAEFARQFDFVQDGERIRIVGVRNFHWRDDKDYDVRWEVRDYDLSGLQSMDAIITTWGMEDIAHVMVSFGFADGQRLVFSVETRREAHEEFSTLGGFFRLYELVVIAGDEKDLIFTRTNIRHEQVSIYPIAYDKTKMRRLFLAYLHQGQRLGKKPRWYHSLLSNCTTLVYEMLKGVETLPLDYRIILSGRLPAYFYEKGVLDGRYSLEEWRQMAFANPKVAMLKNTVDTKTYSQQLRQGLPM